MARDFVAASSNELQGVQNGLPQLDNALKTLAFTFIPDDVTTDNALVYLSRTHNANAQTFWVLFNGANSKIEVVQDYFSGGSSNGVWRWETTLVNGTEYRFVVTYDRGSTTNDPEIFVNGTKYTVGGAGIFERITPSGTVRTGDDCITMGSIQTGGNYFDGRLSEVGLWGAILDDGLCFALSNGYSPEMFAQDRVAYWSLLGSGLTDLDGGELLTATGTTVVDHGLVFYPDDEEDFLFPPAAPPAATDQLMLLTVGTHGAANVLGGGMR